MHSIDVVLPDHNVAEPDVLFLTTEQVVAQTGIHLHGAPALAIEVVSPGSRTMDLELKRGVYDRCGVQEYWIVDPDREEVQVHRRGLPAPWTLSSDRPLAPTRPVDPQVQGSR